MFLLVNNKKLLKFTFAKIALLKKQNSVQPMNRKISTSWQE